MIQHSVIMPVSRPHLIPTLRDKPFGMAGQGVIWVPLYHSDGNGLNSNDFTRGMTAKFGEPEWIKPWNSNWTEGIKVNPGNWKVDKYLDEQLEKDKDREVKFFREDHYISFMTDDCIWAYQHFRKLRRHFVFRRGANEINAKVIISATQAGANIVPAIYNPRKDGPIWENNSCRCFTTRVEALTVRADLMRDIRFGELWCADGLIVEKLCEEHTDYLSLCNDTVVYFNGLRPECWGFPKEHQG